MEIRWSHVLTPDMSFLNSPWTPMTKLDTSINIGLRVLTAFRPADWQWCNASELIYTLKGDKILQSIMQSNPPAAGRQWNMETFRLHNCVKPRKSDDTRETHANQNAFKTVRYHKLKAAVTLTSRAGQSGTHWGNSRMFYIIILPQHLSFMVSNKVTPSLAYVNEQKSQRGFFPPLSDLNSELEWYGGQWSVCLLLQQLPSH